MYSISRIDTLLNRITAFRSLQELQAAAANGYVPTIFHRDARHSELRRALKERGIKVWPSK